MELSYLHVLKWKAIQDTLLSKKITIDNVCVRAFLSVYKYIKRGPESHTQKRW